MTPVGKLSKRSFRLLIDNLQGPVTRPPACCFFLSPRFFLRPVYRSAPQLTERLEEARWKAMGRLHPEIPEEYIACKIFCTISILYKTSIRP